MTLHHKRLLRSPSMIVHPVPAKLAYTLVGSGVAQGRLRMDTPSSTFQVEYEYLPY